MDIWQAINSTPLFRACSIKLSSESICLLRITFRIIRVPIPIIFIFDKDNLRLPAGIIIPNILPIVSFFTASARSFRITFNPQKVKNIVTFRPVDAAPFAITNDANALSRSSLNTISVLLFPAPSFTTGQTPAPFSNTAVIIPFSSFTSTNRFPVIFAHDATSRENPWSVTLISKRSPAFNCSIPPFNFITGPGHCKPQASIAKDFFSTTFSGAFSSTGFLGSGSEYFIGLHCSAIAVEYVRYPPFRFTTS